MAKFGSCARGGSFAKENTWRRAASLFISIYPDGGADDFEWQLFTPAEMISMVDPIGLDLIVSCTEFDRAVEPSPAKPRIQFVLERPLSRKVEG